MSLRQYLQGKDRGKQLSKIFKIDFYPHDWLLDTAIMTPIERGIYIQIVMLIYAKGGPIEKNPRWLAGNCGCDVRQLNPVLERLIQSGSINEVSGKLSQSRCEVELKSKRSYLEKRTCGAYKTNEIKKNKDLIDAERQEISTLTTSTSTSTSTKEESITPKPPKSKKITLDELSVDHIKIWLAEKRAKGIYSHHDENFILEHFRDYCRSKAKIYADYVAAYRNAFAWQACQPKATQAKDGWQDPFGQRNWK